jgi:hypothetical protein
LQRKDVGGLERAASHVTGEDLLEHRMGVRVHAAMDLDPRRLLATEPGAYPEAEAVAAVVSDPLEEDRQRGVLAAVGDDVPCPAPDAHRQYPQPARAS